MKTELPNELNSENERFLGMRAVSQRYDNASGSSIWRMVNDPTLGFPSAVKIRGRNYWRLSDLLRFEQQMEEQIQVAVPSILTLRRRAKKLGIRIEKSRVKSPHFNNQGGYQIVDSRNLVLDGDRYDLDLESVADRIESIEQAGGAA